MKKIILWLLLCAAMLVNGLSATAAPFSGGNVTLDVPDGWLSAFKAGGLSEIRLMAPENVFRMSIVLGPSDGMTPEQGAKMLSGKLEGTEPAPTKNPGMYAFSAQSEVLRCVSMVHGERMMLIIEAGKGGALRDAIGHIIRSLASSHSDEQAMFDSLKPFFQE